MIQSTVLETAESLRKFGDIGDRAKVIILYSSRLSDKPKALNRLEK